MSHRRKVTFSRPYECAECKKSFVRRSVLKTHMKIHKKNQLVRILPNEPNEESVVDNLSKSKSNFNPILSVNVIKENDPNTQNCQNLKEKIHTSIELNREELSTFPFGVREMKLESYDKLGPSSTKKTTDKEVQNIHGNTMKRILIKEEKKTNEIKTNSREYSVLLCK